MVGFRPGTQVFFLTYQFFWTPKFWPGRVYFLRFFGMHAERFFDEIRRSRRSRLSIWPLSSALSGICDHLVEKGFCMFSLQRDLIWSWVLFLFSSSRRGSSRESKHLSAVVGENLDDDRFWFSRGAQNRPANENLKPDLQEVELFVLLFFFVLLDVFQSIHHFDSGLWTAVDCFVSSSKRSAR